MKRLIIYLLIAICLIGGAYAAWMYFKPHQNVLKTKPVFTMSSEVLVGKFLEDIETTNSELLDEIIGISGKVNKIDNQNGIDVISMDNGGDFIIQCYLMPDYQHENMPRVDDIIIIKGRYVGVVVNDEDFMIPADIKLEQCYIID